MTVKEKMTIEELRKKANALPLLPGVYLMKDELGNIIYVGKSKALKKRVRTYFGKLTGERTKIKRMVNAIVDFDYELTDTELDALILECRLIKAYKPMYNSLLKSDKKYRYIKLDANKVLQRAELAYEKGEEGLYFGPYDMPYLLAHGVKAINAYYGLPTCKEVIHKKDCLIYRLGQCSAPCEEENKACYEAKLKQAIDFLEGRDEKILAFYEEKMREAAETFEFDKAIGYRDALSVLRLLGYRKEAIAYSLAGTPGIAFIKKPMGGVKYYILAGTQIVDTRCIEEAELEDLTHKPGEGLIKELKKRFEKQKKEVFQKRSHLEKGEIDEAMILYFYLHTKADCLYLNMEERKEIIWQEMSVRLVDFLCT